MKTTLLNGRGLPLVVELDAGRPIAAPESFLDSCLAERELLRLALLKHGALLLRGCPAPTPAQFARFVREFSGKSLLDYAGGASPRVKLGGGVYTSTEYPSEYSLSLHNELSYTSRWPAHLFFCCVTPAAAGGETPVGDSRAILKGIDEGVVREFRLKGVRYVRSLQGGAASGYSWEDAFETSDRRALERHCRARGIELRWRDDGGLMLTEVRPATAVHPATGEEVWFNQADGFHPSAAGAEVYESLAPPTDADAPRLNCSFGDGSPIPIAALEHVREVTRREAVPVAWSAGDILVLDNVLAAHGRMPFTGPRKILLAMT